MASTTGLQVWLPIEDGLERVGVLEVQCDRLDAPTLLLCRSLAELLALIIGSKENISDLYTQVRRLQPMRLPAEMVWAFLPPRTLGVPGVISTAVVEPAYDLGGDAFDHCVLDGMLHATILDAMGHDLLAGLTSAVALAGCRNSRRAGADLARLTEVVDTAISESFPDRYCTGVFAHLDIRTGELTWTNCGHPIPLLIRGQRLVRGALDRPAEPPLGLGDLLEGPRTVHRCRLRPQDRVLFYTDGVIEARSDSGEPFGLDNFTEYLIRATAAGEPAYEVLRRLIHAILARHRQRLIDDATIMLVEWQPGSDHPPTVPVL
ncbi:PP2C family protein-serine/threonine phosphatase [Sphaerisporangium fuscum]|uniref:PP2C family protein-serine/threonine phosphatase n=1 Tax=Sphaerisporangium fuscum TaxID=2835868 RepID=UPI001BDD7B09|nr:PP2C family protein-serine/threonine phosphatase [Sphaerisporangium fuscum]